jgi:uncharacterized RDD family membrane protein YckC
MNPNSPYEGQQDLIAPDVFLNPIDYAGFWLRVGAYLIDVIVIYAAIFIIAIPFGLDSSMLKEANNSAAFWAGYSVLCLGLFAYFPIMESSKFQATIGKRAVGIIVTGMDGERISLGKALARFFSKILSCIIFYIGFMMAGFTEKKQGLHDMIASTLVVKRGHK